MMSAAFHGVGGATLKDMDDLKKIPIWRRKQAASEYLAHNFQVVKDYNGFVFFCATDQFISIVFS